MDRVTLIALLFSALGCKHVDGGAVEATWVFVTPDGRTISDCSCACPSIAKIRMELLPLDPANGSGDACAGRSACAFSCNQKIGATQFEIPAGLYQVRLVPVGAEPTDITGSEAGACRAEGRAYSKPFEVVVGRVTQLDALQMIADCTPECGGSDNNRVCKR